MEVLKRNSYKNLVAVVLSGMAVSAINSDEQSKHIFQTPQSIIASAEQVKNTENMAKIAALGIVPEELPSKPMPRVQFAYQFIKGEQIETAVASAGFIPFSIAATNAARVDRKNIGRF